MQRWTESLVVLAVLVVERPAHAVDPTAFVLESGTQGAACPELEQVRSAVERRLGQLVLDGRRGWRAVYGVSTTSGGAPADVVRLELYGPDQRLELQRDLPMAGEACSTMSEVIALVLDRHFRGLGQDERHTPLDALPASPPAHPGATAPKTALTGTPTLPGTPPTRRATLARAAAEPAASAANHSAQAGSDIDVAIELSESWQLRQPALALRSTARVGSHALVGGALGVSLKPEEEYLNGGARVTADTLALRGFVAWSNRLGPTRWYVGPSLGCAFQQGRSHELPETTGQQVRALWSLGLEAGWTIPFTSRWFLQVAARTELGLPFLSGKFYVEGNEVLARAPIDLGVGLGLGYGFSLLDH